MLPFQNLILPDKDSAFPVFRQITDQLIGLVQEGLLQPGIFLPGTRQMAEMLSVNRKTIIKVYEEMMAQDWLESVTRKGYRVIPELPLIKPRTFQPKNSAFLSHSGFDYRQLNTTVSFSGERKLKFSDILVDDGYPDPRLSPYREMNRVYSDQTSTSGTKHLLPSRPQGGLKELKDSTSAMLNDSRGLNISANEIVISRGGQMPLFLAATVLIERGDLAAVAEINDPLANEIMEHAGAKLLKIKMEADGIDLFHLEETLKTNRIKLLYLVPHHHYPTTNVMSGDKRLELLRLMKLYDFWVIEHDLGYDFDFSNSPILPIASADHGGKLIYISSFDRIISRSIRLGYLVACPEIISSAIHLQGLIDQHGDVQMENMLSRMIKTGDFQRHISKSKKIYAQRCEFLSELLETRMEHLVHFERPKGGMALWLDFGKEFPMENFIRKTAENGLYLEATQFCSKYKSGFNTLRFGYASLTEKELDRAVDIMFKVSLQLTSRMQMTATPPEFFIVN